MQECFMYKKIVVGSQVWNADIEHVNTAMPMAIKTSSLDSSP